MVMKEAILALLAERGVRLPELAELVFQMQRPHIPGLSMEACQESVERVVEKREAQYAILTGIALDQAAERRGLHPLLEQAIRGDDPLFGIDEVLALAITNLYGSAGLVGFGYLDKVKPGVIGRLNRAKDGRVHTFLDDLLAAVAAAAGARLAHKYLAPPSEEGAVPKAAPEHVAIDPVEPLD